MSLKNIVATFSDQFKYVIAMKMGRINSFFPETQISNGGNLLSRLSNNATYG